MTSPYKAICLGVMPESLQIIKRQLPSEEFDIQIAADLRQMKEVLKQGIPDIVYIASTTTTFDPFQITLKLSGAGVAVLMISNAPTRQLIIKVAKCGALDLLVSPLDPKTVIPKTDRALIRTGKKALPEDTELKMDFGHAKTPTDKVKVLMKKVDALLALPFSVVKIIQLCNDPSTSAKDLEKPVQSDPAITAMIMRRANSAAYAGIGETTSIQRAVVRIGLKATRNIAASFSVFKLFDKDEKTFGFNRVWFWVHSLTTGICAQVLATLLRHRQPEDAFIAGLLHDIGKMILDDFLREDFQKALLKANTLGLSMKEAERSVFDVHHAFVGSRVSRGWGFPALISDAIARHHNERLADEAGGLSIDAFVCMGNHMAKAMLAGSGGDHLAEREVLALWDRLPKGIPWRKITGKVIEELRDYIDLLEIPPEQFQMDLPGEENGRAGIFIPRSPNYGSLLQITLERQGLQTVLFSSLEDPALKKEQLILAVGDLTAVENEEEADKFKEGMASVAKKSVILPHHLEKKGPFNLDFFWLESEVNRALGKV